MHSAAQIEGPLAIAAHLVNTHRSALMAPSAEHTLPSTAVVVALTAVVVAFMAVEVEDFMVVAAVADMVVAVATVADTNAAGI